MSERLRCVAPVGDKCGEAATWSAEEQALYWCDVNRFLIHRLDAEERVASWYFDQPVTALSLTEQPGVWLVALGSRLILWRPAEDSRREHGFQLAQWPTARLNDGRAAPNGDFWIGTMANNVGPNGEPGAAPFGHGVLHRLQPGGRVTEIKRELGISNTVCWSPDRTTFYFADTLQNTIWAYDYDVASGEISGERPFFSGFERGVPDGSSVDAAGRLWNCRFDGGCVVCVAPDGTIEQVLEVPARNVTTCAFGGADLKTLYITTAAMETSASDRLAGSLFAYQADVAGLESFKAKL
ncbi:SMP-30/gluconolactonase/LRE family protein [Phenylobacterium sp. LjRoot219]|uniref:SMP-30/gluconolactonase/LRE family protein n=1 Tax=Phenylobacterium sp. LjRoot219 TaxID=3342283 RepID=UPI003ED077F9